MRLSRRGVPARFRTASSPAGHHRGRRRLTSLSRGLQPLQFVERPIEAPFCYEVTIFPVRSRGAIGFVSQNAGLSHSLGLREGTRRCRRELGLDDGPWVDVWPLARGLQPAEFMERPVEASFDGRLVAGELGQDVVALHRVGKGDRDRLVVARGLGFVDPAARLRRAVARR